MKFGLRITFLLFLVTGTVTVKGSDLSDALDDSDSNHQTAADRPKRWSGLHLFDFLRGDGNLKTSPEPTYPTSDPIPSSTAAGSESTHLPTGNLKTSPEPTYPTSDPIPSSTAAGSESTHLPTGNLKTSPEPTYPTSDPIPSSTAAGSESTHLPTDDFGFSLDDALHPAVTPSDEPAGGDCHGDMVQKLSTIIENQNQELLLLMQLVAHSFSQNVH
ncbi:uncharacterized protein PB18E9.04c-like isoform X1 [Thunnus maccoyii]|uniref:uncharacterized protein PB18E9.04c-like isoform X1 n=1 Tax=Thunnus maccoyii TaxID=8240 RepID=UPI001C4BC957|nr:uncharacterized protein PB18E9.04c-like isoform X1 [Thunnus maccoyii]XP_042261068.1 uncharacterized protein PB18E9.04c-like isoform X1 [Thunnus maccoyii]